jgi:hypothetical protein
MVEDVGRAAWMMLQRGKTVTPQWLAQQLQTYEIRPKTMRIGDERAKGHEMEDFKETFRRYIPRSEFENFRKKWRNSGHRGKKGAVRMGRGRKRR